MKKEIIPIEFKQGKYKAYDESLKQWNHSQQLAISGLDISDEIVEVHFSLQEYEGNAKRMVGTVIDGTIHVGIPVFILEGPEWSSEYYNAYAWIYLSDEESAETVRKIEFTIEARPNPDEYVTPEELTFLQQLELAIQNKLDKSGHAPNKFLGTDEKGNVVTKEQEEFSLEVADEKKLGGVKPLNKTDDMTLEVGVDKDGRLFAKGKDIKVDSELSEESENPVQNKVLTKEVITLKEHNTKLKETIEKLQIKVTTEKASFHNIKDSANMKVVDFGMEGKTEQNTVAGNQLFDKNTVPLLNELLQNDGTPSPSPNLSFAHTDFIEILSNETYTIACLDSNCIITGVYFYDENKAFISINKTFTGFITPENTKYIMIGFCKSTYDVFTDVDLLNLPESIMLVKGSTKPTTYEPYTNGPSPNPDYPQEIKNAGVYNEETGRYEHKCCVGNKNWFDIDDFKSTSKLLSIGIMRCYKLNIVPGQTYTFNRNNSNGYNVEALNNVRIIDGDSKTLGVFIDKWTSSMNKSSVTFTATKEVYLGFTMTIEKVLPHFDTYFIDPQLEIGPVATSFKPYEAPTEFTLTSPVPLTKWDYKAKRDGLHGWSVNHEKFNPKGKTITSVGYRDETTCVCNFSVPNAVATQLAGSGITCNRAIAGNVATGNVAKFRIYNNSLQIRLPYPEGVTKETSDADTKSAYKEMFNNVEYIFEYQTAEEVSFHPLPDEEQELLHNLETYYGVTNLYNDQGCPMWIKYVADTKLYMDNQLLEIKSAIV